MSNQKRKPADLILTAIFFFGAGIWLGEKHDGTKPRLEECLDANHGLYESLQALRTQQAPPRSKEVVETVYRTENAIYKLTCAKSGVNEGCELKSKLKADQGKD